MSERAERCDRCRSWEEIPPGNIYGTDGICRAMPPEPKLLMHEDGNWSVVNLWSGTDRDAWCGCFELPDLPLSDPLPINKDPGRTMRHALNAVEGEVPTE